MAEVVRSVGFAPVKGMRHLALDHVDLDEHGAVGDRALCVVDPVERRVLKTGQHPTLMRIVARTYGDRLALTLPSGAEAEGPAPASGGTITCDYWGRQVDLVLTDGPHADLVSTQLDRDVRLARAPRGGVVFGEPITLVTTASLAAIGEDDARRFRATFVLETEEPWVEDTWVGTDLAVGDAVIRIGGPIPRCAVIDLHPESGDKDTRLLKALVRSRPTNTAGEPMFGVYATVTDPGRVAVTR